MLYSKEALRTSWAIVPDVVVDGELCGLIAGPRISKYRVQGKARTKQGRGRQGKATQDKTRQGKARQDKTRQGNARQDKTSSTSVEAENVDFTKCFS